MGADFRCSAGQVQRGHDDVLRVLGQLHDEGQHECEYYRDGTRWKHYVFVS